MNLPKKPHYICKQLNSLGMDSDKSKKQKFQQCLEVQLSATHISVFIPPACFSLSSSAFYFCQSLSPFLYSSTQALIFYLFLFFVLFLSLCSPAASPFPAHDQHWMCLGVSEGNPLPQTPRKSRPGKQSSERFRKRAESNFLFQ